MSYDRIHEGSWLKETFVTPREDWLNIHLDGCIELAKQANLHCKNVLNIPDMYMKCSFDFLEIARRESNKEYKQYALLGFLYSSKGFQLWVEQHEPLKEAYDYFMHHLNININVYIGGLHFDGSKFTPSDSSSLLTDRQIYLFVQVMREIATHA